MKRAINTNVLPSTRKRGQVALCSSNHSKAFLKQHPTFEAIEICKNHQLHPVVLKNDLGYCFENIWQFCKIHESVEKVHQKTWSHDAETHILFGDTHTDASLTPSLEYWQWREKGMTQDQAVNGSITTNTKKKWLGVLWDPTSSDPAENTVGMRSFDFFSARKNVFGRTYADLAKNTEEFQFILENVEAGINVVIVVDLLIEYPCKTLDHEEATFSTGFIVTPQNIASVLTNGNCTFGFGHVLAAMLLVDGQKLF